ncbi:putative RNA methyltransferase [Alkalimarinus coralli]|uniref:putative RNA methyltransferase n=1 Tax=Alkalimarinus coralli TaxID=2935863 RepID=UPI00202B3361|nr:hypothetical protein [Alkalimarinus coralli]
MNNAEAESGSLICPVCQQPLKRKEKQFCCNNNHQYDVAKQGYVNLLLPQHKKSKQPGDSLEMVEARYRFLDAGYYKPISDKLNEFILNDYLSKSREAASYHIADAGSGEGYYTEKLQQHLNTAFDSNPPSQQQGALKRAGIIGFDISQRAVKASCRRTKSIQWVTATSSHIPIKSDSQSAVLCLFSRIVPEEFRRILKQDGLLYVASTGPEHLIELREKLYQDVKQQAYNPTSTLENEFVTLEPSLCSNIKYKIELTTSQAISDLLLMTPHYWRATESAKSIIKNLDSIEVTIDVFLTGYRPCQE